MYAMEQRKKFLLLWGGTDVNPRCYGHDPLLQTSSPDLLRDSVEFAAVARAFATGMPILGVCRGAQLLCVANGGSLYQHTANHGWSHGLQTKDRFIPSAHAGHHQVMNPEGTDHKLLAWSYFDTEVLDKEGKNLLIEKSAEIVWFPKTKCLAIQPHPEWEPEGTEFKIWINELVYKYMGEKDVF